MYRAVLVSLIMWVSNRLSRNGLRGKLSRLRLAISDKKDLSSVYNYQVVLRIKEDLRFSTNLCISTYLSSWKEVQY